MVLDIEAINTFEPAVSGDYWTPEGSTTSVWTACSNATRILLKQ